MPKSNLTVEMTGEEAKLWASLQKVTAGQKQVAGGFDKIAAASKKADAQERQLARSAARTLREIQTPQERYNAKIKELTTLRQASKLSEEQYGRAVAQAKAQMVAAGQATEAARRRKQQQATATREATRREEEYGRAARQVLQQIQSPQERYNAKLRQLGTLLRAGKLSQDQFTRAARQAKGELDGAGRAGDKAFGPNALSMVRSFASALGMTGGVAGAVMLIRNEYQTMLDTMQRAKEASMPLADAQIKALRNLGATSEKERDRFTDALTALSAETGVPERDLYLRASSALSARGALSVDTALGAVRESARLVPESAEEGTAVAGAALDLAKITGVEDAKKNIGLLMAIGQTARITQVGPLAENVAPAVTGLTARGGTAREAGAIFSALTGGMADPTGRRSATAAITLGEELAKFLPDVDRFEFVERDGIKQRELATKGTGLKTALQRLQHLQAHPELAEEFLGQASFEKKAQSPVEQLVTGKGPAAVALGDYLNRIPSVTEAGALYDTRLAVQRGGELQKTAAFGRATETAVEGLGVSDQGRARRGIIQEHFVPLMQDAGMGGLASKLAGIKGASGTALEDYAGIIRGRHKYLTRTEDVSQTPYSRSPRIAHTPTPVEVKQAAILQQLLDAIKQLKPADKPAEESKPQEEMADKLSAGIGRTNTLLEQMASKNPTLGSPFQDA